MKMADKPTTSFSDDSRIKTAASYGQRKDAVESSKVSTQVGGADPIPPGKLKPIIPPQYDGPPAHDGPPNGPPPVGGVGSAYPVNQALARGDIKNPITMDEAQRRGLHKPERKPMSEESLDALKAVKDENDDSPPAVDDGISEDDMRKAEEDIAEAGKREVPFDLNEIMMLRNPLASEDRREKIEERLEPLDISDLIMRKEIQQTVEVVPDKLSVTFRTINQKENLWILRYLHNFSGSDMYVEGLLDTFKMVCSITAVNGGLLPEHRDHLGTRDEEIDEKLFEEKMHHLASYPVQLFADFGVQLNWFNRRVNKLFTLENLGNG